MKPESALVCNMDVFTPTERDAHIRTTRQLFESVQHVREMDNGYQFKFPNETEFIVKIAEFISRERLCCPFLDFILNIRSNDQTISLLLTGPIGTQEFLRAEFDGAIP